MQVLTIVLASAFTCQSITDDAVGPKDAMMANISSLRSKLHFSLAIGTAPDSALDREAVFSGVALPFRESAKHRLLGEWSTDGQTEMYRCYSASADAMEQLQKQLKENAALPSFSSDIHPDVTILTDFVNTVEFNETEHSLTVQKLDGTALRQDLVNPFISWLGERLQDYTKRFSKSEKIHIVINGKPYDVEVYQKYLKDGWERLEIHYDPSIGFLPRYCKLIDYAGEKQPSAILETLLVSTNITKTGAFIPMEWYKIRYRTRETNNFEKVGYLDTPKSLNGLSLEHFHATQHEEFTSNNKITLPKDMFGFSTRGGLVKFSKTDAKELTLDNFVSNAGEKMNRKAKITQINIDTQEINKNFEQKPNYFKFIIGGVLAIIIFAYVAFRFKTKARASFIVLFLLSHLSGCSSNQQEENAGSQQQVKLAAKFIDPFLLVDSSPKVEKIQLSVKNQGLLPVQIFSMNGGCTCRSVDQSHFPMNLGPGKFFQVIVSMAPNLSNEIQTFPFSLTTDKGTFVVPVKLLAVASHRVDPDVMNVSLRENQSFEFDVKQIFTTTKQSAPVLLPPRASDEFIVSLTGTNPLGKLHDSDFYQTEATYRLTLKNQHIGLHKEAILFANAGGDFNVSLPVIWKRSAFLGTIPDRIVLGPRPSRVFLRCSDETVELVSVLEKPPGVQVVIASPREMIVSLESDAPSVFTAHVKVITSHQQYKELDFQVYRYAPSYQSSESKPTGN